jgi:hypothetical protein
MKGKIACFCEIIMYIRGVRSSEVLLEQRFGVMAGAVLRMTVLW